MSRTQPFVCLLIGEPALTRRVIPRLTVWLALGDTCSVDVDKRMMTWIHHYGAIWSITALKLLLCLRNFFQNENTHIINIQIKKQLCHGHLAMGDC